MGDNIWSTLFYVFVMVAVLLAAYFTTKYLGKTSRAVKGKHIVVLDRMGIAKDKMLMLVKVGGKSMLIGVTNQSISSLGDVEVSEAPEEQAEPQSAQNPLSRFAQVLANVRNAPGELARARREARQQRGAPPEPRDAVEKDYLDQISRAIERRKNAKIHGSEDMDE